MTSPADTTPDGATFEPGGPLCGCDTCERVRRETGVEELTPELVAESERRQAATAAEETR